ncbi:MAG: CotH kinase family protein [Bacteroidia bacterium]|nr:CotH kinase family protein [Bacteroidia bacterium]
MTHTNAGNQLLRLCRHIDRIFIGFLLLLPAPSVGQNLVINEFMSSNSGFFQDEDGEAVDWIELYNTADVPLSLAGYSLSDKRGTPDKWLFPDTAINAHSFIVVFASGKDRADPGKPLHTNFKIDADGEHLLLSCGGCVVSSVGPVQLKSNTSFGAVPDGCGSFVVLLSPTPGAPNGGECLHDVVTFSTPGGRYERVFELTLSCREASSRIHYTTDGSTPTSESPKYSQTLMLDSTLWSKEDIASIRLSPPDFHIPYLTRQKQALVLRAAAFDSAGRRVSDVATHSYFIRELGVDHEKLPVVSICSDPDGLFDDSTGIMVPGVYWKESDPHWTGNYFQRGDEWERGAHIELYEADGANGFRHNVGLRIHGGFTRRFMQKSMAVYARNDYGGNSMVYPLFHEKPTTVFRRLVLRTLTSTLFSSGIEDIMGGKLASMVDVDWPASRPAVLYLNGAYWGIYFIQEKMDEHFVEGATGVSADSIDIIVDWTGWPDHGSGENFQSLYSFIEHADLTKDSVMDVVSSWIDVDNFIDYQLLEIVIANTDWPVTNMKMWRERKDGARWRWMYFDGDAAMTMADFDAFENALCTKDQPWPTNARSTLFLRKLLTNDDFNARFFRRLEHVLNNEFAFETMSPLFRDITLQINSEIPRQIQRFPMLQDYCTWLHCLGSVFDFLRYRHCSVGRHATEHFGIRMQLPDCPEGTSDAAMQASVTGPAIAVYPNPGNGMVTLELKDAPPQRVLLEVSDMLGRKVHSAESLLSDGDGKLTIDLGGLPSGPYLLRFIGRQRQQTFRIFISRQ